MAVVATTTRGKGEVAVLATGMDTAQSILFEFSAQDPCSINQRSMGLSKYGPQMQIVEPPCDNSRIVGKPGIRPLPPPAATLEAVNGHRLQSIIVLRRDEAAGDTGIPTEKFRGHTSDPVASRDDHQAQRRLALHF
jgi:hypothetical protein